MLRKPAEDQLHQRRITFYVLLLFAGFVISWLVLLAKIRSDDNRPTLVTEVEIHSLQARWGMDLLVVPIVAAAIALMRRKRHVIGDVVIAIVIGDGPRNVSTHHGCREVRHSDRDRDMQQSELRRIRIKVRLA